MISPAASNQPRKRHQNYKRRPHFDPLPLSETGQHLAHLFPNGWDWIYTPTPAPGDRPQWETITQFPLSPIEQEQLHQDPSCIIGIRPGSQTRWLVIDIDKHSPYHPSQTPQWLPQIQQHLEDIGLCRILINQSSYSGGLHLYLPLPHPVSSFWLSTCIQQHLQALGITLKAGECELYPNPKRYIPQGQGFSKFAAIRLPMQPNSGFTLLDPDLNPQPCTLAQWLHLFEQSASAQDIHTLTRAIEHSKQNHRIRKTRHPQSLDSWHQRIQQEKQQGWTGPHQTNEKLKTFACEARVFMGMDSPHQIAHHIETTALNSPGFQEHSNHTHNLKQRSLEIAHWSMRYYWPIGTNPTRETHYQSPQTAPADFNYHQSKREAAQHRIKQAVQQLKQQNQLPDTITARAQAIAHQAHVSQKTLYKAFNKPLWHPAHQPEQQTTQTTPSTPSTLQQPKPAPPAEIFQPQKQTLKTDKIKSLHPLTYLDLLHLFIYVGFVILVTEITAATALTLKGQKAVKAACPSSDVLHIGGVTGGINPTSSTTEPPEITNWQQLKLSLPKSLQTKINRNQFNPTQRHLTLVTPLHSKQSTPPDRTAQKTRSKPQTRLKPQQHTPAEQAEFSSWYQLAQRFNLVTDSYWENGQYWVISTDEIYPYVELSATFTTRTLKRMLGDPESPSTAEESQDPQYEHYTSSAAPSDIPSADLDSTPESEPPPAHP
ncbi:hypothetical protein ACSYAD_27475 [Acaryochloris marina NIES-2412]|uniref:hypothetical protein n=1 Tax=Acaryochloris marina TaxID=155978 RepID=UPI0040580BFD